MDETVEVELVSIGDLDIDETPEPGDFSVEDLVRMAESGDEVADEMLRNWLGGRS